MTRRSKLIFLVLMCFALLGVSAAHAASYTVTYSYDALNRLTQARYSTGAQITYTYDAVGNRIALTSTPGATLGVQGTQAAEGKQGADVATFPVTLAAPADHPVTVDYNTADGTAKAGKDYVPATGQLTFEPGETTKTINVQVKGASQPGSPETFIVHLTNPMDATVGTPDATGTITAPPAVAPPPDLSGSWHLVGAATSGTPGGLTGSLTVGTGGTVTAGTLVDPNGADPGLSGGRLVVRPDGAIEGLLTRATGNELVLIGRLAADGALAFSTYWEYAGDTVVGYGTLSLVRAPATPPALADLAGTWAWRATDLAGGEPGWTAGTLTLDATGNLTGGAGTTDTGTLLSVTEGNLALASTGEVTGTLIFSTGATTALHAILQPDRHLLLGIHTTTSSAATATGLVALVRSPATLPAQADVAGTWGWVAAEAGPTAPDWTRGALTLDGTGQVGWNGLIDAAGLGTALGPGALSVDTAGRLTGTLPRTAGGTTQLDGVLASGGDVLVAVETTTVGAGGPTMGLVLVVRRGVPEPAACRPTPIPLPLAVPTAGTLAAGTCRAAEDDAALASLFTFDGAGTDLIDLDLTATGFLPQLTLRGPRGGVIAGDAPDTLTAGLRGVSLPEPGTYTVEVRGQEPAAGGSFTLTRATATAGCTTPPALTLGQPVSGVLAAGPCRSPLNANAYADRYAVVGSAGDVLTITLDGAVPLDALLVLVGPDGEIVASDDDSGEGLNARIARFSFPLSGTYTLVVTSYPAGQVGAYTLLATSGAPACPAPQALVVGTPISGTLAPTACPASADSTFPADRYTFTGTAGATLNVTVLPAGSTGKFGLALLTPAGSRLAADGLETGDLPGARLRAIRLPVDGLYTVEVIGTDLLGDAVATGPYELTAVAVTGAVLTVTPAGPGQGTVTSTPAGIICGSTCSAAFALGTPVTLTATPASNSSFAGWSGACTALTGACTLTLDQAQSVTATFALADPRAVLLSPANGSTLTGTTQTFTWSAGTGALEYALFLGTTPGGPDLFISSTGLNTGVTVNNLPGNGSPIYVRLYTRFATGWEYTDYTLTAAMTQAKAVLLSPANGSTLAGTSQAFTWTAGLGALEYALFLGTTPGNTDLFVGSTGLTPTVTVAGLPTGGSPLYIRLFTRFPGGWQYTDYGVTTGP